MMKRMIIVSAAIAMLCLLAFSGEVTSDYAAWKAAMAPTTTGLSADFAYVLKAKAEGSLDLNDPAYLRVIEAARRSGVRFEGGALDQAIDWCPGTPVGALPYTDTGTTCGYVDDETDCFNDAPDVMYVFTPTVTAVYDVNLCGSSYDTRLEIRYDGACPGNIQLCCNDDACGVASQCIVPMTAGTTYYIIVDGYSSYCGDYVLNILLAPPVGRCCYNNNLNCVDNVSETVCTSSYGGVWAEGLTCGTPCPPPPGVLCNTVVCVQTDTDGDFNIGTADNRSLLYYWPASPWSTDLRVRVDGLVYNLDTPGAPCDGAATFVSVTNDGVRFTVVYTLLGYLDIVVTHTPVLFTATTGAILTKTVVYNNDTAEHNIGVLYEYDTTVDGDDAAELYYGPNHLLNETCYDAPFDYTYWDAIPLSGTLVGRGTFTGGEAVTPDHLAFGQWGYFYATCWDRVCSGLPYGDSAVLYQWDEDPIPGGGSRTVATYYGVGELEIVPGDLQISVSQPPLHCVTPPGVVQPNPFQILVNITNTGGSTCHNIAVHLTNGAGPGGTGTVISANPQIIPSLNPGNNAAVSFTVQGNFNPAGGCINFTVHVTSDDCPANQAPFCVYVPPCEPCYFYSEEMDMGDLWPCNYPTLVSNPSHELTNIAWLGEWVTPEPAPNIFNMDPADDGVFYHGPFPWRPCTPQVVDVLVTAGPVYPFYAYECGGHLFLNGWKDGNMDGDFCDVLGDCMAPEWIVQDVPVVPGFWTFTFPDPGVFDLGIYPGVFRWRLTSHPVGPHGFGLVDQQQCPDMVCGTFDHDFLGEVEDYWLPDHQWDVELTSFTAIAGEGEIVLNWTTGSETSNDHFEIVRNDALLTSVATQGNGPEGHTYTYEDRDVVVGSTYTYRLVSVDVNGAREELATRTVMMSAPAAAVTEYALAQNYPNPFNPITHITYDLVEGGFVNLRVYNLMGQEVATVVNGSVEAGRHAVVFDAGDLPTGVYVYRLTVNGFSAEKKMVLMK